MSIDPTNLAVSFIIPSLSVPNEIYTLIEKIIDIKRSEVIVVNQNPKRPISRLTCSNIKEILVDKAISASEARNLGASIANGEFLFFLDDDADLLNVPTNLVDYIDKNSDKCDVLVFDRCYKIGNILHSYNPSVDRWYKSHWSMAKFVTEWNTCLRKSVFLKAGMFPGIGTGSASKAQSGEMFVLFSSIYNITDRISYLPIVKVIHPPYAGEKPLEKCLGYYYGAGYSVGLSLINFSSMFKAIWILRSFSAAIRDLLIPISSLLKPSDCRANLLYKCRISSARIFGLIDGLRTPKYKVTT